MSFLLDKTLYQIVVSQFLTNRFLICETLFQSLNSMPATTLLFPSLETNQI